jgi:hypothetical protein
MIELLKEEVKRFTTPKVGCVIYTTNNNMIDSKMAQKMEQAQRSYDRQEPADQPVFVLVEQKMTAEGLYDMFAKMMYEDDKRLYEFFEKVEGVSDVNWEVFRNSNIGWNLQQLYNEWVGEFEPVE